MTVVTFGLGRHSRDVFVSFLDKNRDKKNDSKLFNSSDDLKGVDIKFDLDVNNLAEIEIVLDLKLRLNGIEIALELN